MTTTNRTAVKRVVKKKATVVAKAAVKRNNNLSLTIGQAKSIQAFLTKNGKSYKVLDSKLNALNA